jgi:hypothetical protein
MSDPFTLRHPHRGREPAGDHDEARLEPVGEGESVPFRPIPSLVRNVNEPDHLARPSRGLEGAPLEGIP